MKRISLLHTAALFLSADTSYILEDLSAMFFKHSKGFIADVVFNLAGIGPGGFIADTQMGKDFNQRIVAVIDRLGDLLSRRKQSDISGRVAFDIPVFF